MKRLFLTSSVCYVARDIMNKLGNKKEMKLLFINTPVEKYDRDLSWQEKDRNALVEAGFEVTNYTITGKTSEQIERAFQSTDIVYVSGGNVFYFMQQVQETSSAELFRKYVENGGIYISTSAGSFAAGPDISVRYRQENIKHAPNLQSYEGLSLVDFLVFPHWGTDYFRDRYLKSYMEQAYNEKNKIILLTDYQYVMVEDEWMKIVEVERQ